MKKYYSIEFLRVWLLFLIILSHTAMVNYYGSLSAFFGKVLYSMGTHVDIFLLICGFFLFKSVNKENTSFWPVLKHRMLRLLPALVFCKLCIMIFLNHGLDYALTNLTMLNANIGIYVPTISHIIWFVDAMFWCWIFYAALFILFDKKKSLFSTALISFAALMMLFLGKNVDVHFHTLGFLLIDGGLLRCLSFMGMGILLSAIPLSISNNSDNKVSKSYAFAAFELLVVVMAFLYPGFVVRDTGMVLNHVLWAALFVFLAVREYGLVFKFLNKQKWVSYVSKYCYEIYVFQLFAIIIGQRYLFPQKAPILTGLAIVVLSFGFGKLFKDYVEPAIFKVLNIKGQSLPDNTK